MLQSTLHFCSGKVLQTSSGVDMRTNKYDLGVEPGERWLFPGRRKGLHLTQRQVTRLFHESVAAAGLKKKLTLHEPIDEALKSFGLEREIITIVDGFSTALALARATDLIASVPERHTGILRAGMHSFRLPVSTPEFTVSLLWHPRLDADPAHRWLRGCVQDACKEQLTDSSKQGRVAEG